MLIQYEPFGELEMDDEYSFKDFADKSLKDVPIEELNGKNIYASNFYQQNCPELKDIFPDKMTGVTFYNCVLDNVFVPEGNTIIDPCGRHRRIQIQNDNNDWILDDNLKPIKMLNPPPPDKMEAGIAGDFDKENPINLPSKFERQIIITKKEWDETFGQSIIPEKTIGEKEVAFFKEIPQITKTETRKVIKDCKKEDWNKMEQENNYKEWKAKPNAVQLKTAIIGGKKYYTDKSTLNIKGFRPVQTELSDKILLSGEIEYHTIKGEAWVYKGQKDKGSPEIRKLNIVDILEGKWNT